MAEPYLGDLKAIVARTGASPEGVVDISCRHFFAGAAAYVDGRIFMTLTPVGLALKLGQDDRAVLLERGARPLRYFPRAPVKKDYVLLPRPYPIDDDELQSWIIRCIAFARL